MNAKNKNTPKNANHAKAPASKKTPEQRKAERDARKRAQAQYEEMIDLLMDIGVPFGPDGEPLGIGWGD